MQIERGLTIGEAADRAGVAASALRYWERLGLIDAPARLGGKRRYERALLDQIEMVVRAKRAGFSLAEIGVLLAGISAKTPPPALWRELAATKLPEIERTLAEARAMKAILARGLRCQCISLEECLTRASG